MVAPRLLLAADPYAQRAFRVHRPLQVYTGPDRRSPVLLGTSSASQRCRPGSVVHVLVQTVVEQGVVPGVADMLAVDAEGHSPGSVQAPTWDHHANAVIGVVDLV